MANIPKDPIIGQASEFEKHLRKQEELVRDSKGKGPTRYYANRKPEWAAGAHDEDGDDGFTGAFDQQQPQQHQQPLSQITIGSVTAAEGSSSGGVPRERARRREKVAPSVVSAGGNEPGSIANEVSDPRLRRLLRNEIKKAVKEEPPNDSSGSGAGESNTSSSSRRGRRQRIKAEIIQHQKDLEVQEKTQVQAQDAATSSSQVIMKNEEDNDPVRNDNNDGIPHHLTRKELHNAIKMRELKPSQEAGTDRGHYNSNRAEPISGSSNNKESVTIKTEKVESKGKDDDDDDNDEEEEEDDDDEEEEEENEWPEMMVPAFVPREERILPKIEESLKREEEYFRQSEIDRKKRSEEEARERLKNIDTVTADVDNREEEEEDGPFRHTTEAELDDEDENEALEEWKKREAERIRLETLERESFEKGALRKGRDEAKAKGESEKVKPWKPKEKWKFLQKYYHSGAFFKDGGEWDVDASGKWDFDLPTGEDAWMDKANLPKVLQVRNFGKRKQTKHTNLRDEDTTEFSNNDKDTEAFLKKAYEKNMSGVSS